MSVASPVGYCWGWASAAVDVLTVQPAGVGCLQVQPVETIQAGSDVQPEVSGEQVSMFFDAAPAAVDPLRERLFLAVPAQTGLGQGRGFRVELVETITAGACSLAAHHLHQQPWCPIPHTAREVLLPCDEIELLARDISPMGEQLVGQRTVQRLAALSQPAVQLADNGGGLLGGG